MDFTAILLLLGLMGTACGGPVCPTHCQRADHNGKQFFSHVSDLNESSVAPWKLTVNVSEGRDPEVIQHAVCKSCTVTDMIAKPIYFQISVYERIQTAPVTWCMCPYQLAVGCTCVKKQ